MRRRFPWSVLFIAVALLALAAVPVWLGQRVASVDREISQVLEPARNAAAQLEAIYAREMSRFQEYLLTGSSGARRRYETLVQEERIRSSELERYLASMDLRMNRLALPVFTSASEWHVGHQQVFETPEAREALLADLSADLDRYEEVLRASGALRTALSQEMGEGEARMEATRALQSRLTSLLVIVALIATFAVARLAGRLATAVEEGEARRQEAVRARREIDAVLEATAETVLGLDLGGRVISLNQAGARLLGFTEEDARGRTFHTVIHAGAPSQEETEALPEARAIARALEEGVAVDGVDGQVHPRRGGVVEVRWSLRPLVDGTTVRGAVLTIRDMRAVRAAERALQAAVRAREETMAVVGHDLRSPLSSISAAAELLLDVPLPEDRRRLQLRAIQAAAERMNALIGDLLDLARIDAGGFRVAKAPASPGSLLDRALRLAQPQAARVGVRLVKEWPADLSPVELDDHRILQVLSNLVSNALRYTAEGGEVAVGAEERPGAIEFWVRDTGSGIDPADLPHLWDPFWQPNRDRHARREGAGLGLAIVKGIVEAHGGSVRVDSRPGEGSRFSFVLGRPRVPEDSTAVTL